MALIVRPTVPFWGWVLNDNRAAGRADTLTLARASLPSERTRTTVCPGPVPVTSPLEETVATVAASLEKVTVLPESGLPSCARSDVVS
jgi:hypothetical protein